LLAVMIATCVAFPMTVVVTMSRRRIDLQGSGEIGCHRSVHIPRSAGHTGDASRRQGVLGSRPNAAADEKLYPRVFENANQGTVSFVAAVQQGFLLYRAVFHRVQGEGF